MSNILNFARKKAKKILSCKINNFSATRNQNRYTFETAKGRNLKFRAYIGYI